MNANRNWPGRNIQEFARICILSDYHSNEINSELERFNKIKIRKWRQRIIWLLLVTLHHSDPFTDDIALAHVTFLLCQKCFPGVEQSHSYVYPNRFSRRENRSSRRRWSFRASVRSKKFSILASSCSRSMHGTKGSCFVLIISRYSRVSRRGCDFSICFY